jgi:hypothetical protein
MADSAKTAIKNVGLHLLTDRGEVLHPVSKKAGRFVFILPETAGSLRLRPLGVLVGTIKLTRGRRKVALRIDHAAQAGRIDGDATLTIPDNHGLKLPGVLEIQILAVGPCVQAAPPPCPPEQVISSSRKSSQNS